MKIFFARGEYAFGIKDYNQKQTFLLPPSVEDFVGPKHPARIISDIIDTTEVASISIGKTSHYHIAIV